MNIKFCLLLFLFFTTTVKANTIAKRYTVDWDAALQKLVVGLTGQIPVVGTYVSLLLDIFWPQNQPEDIWSTISEKVERLVDKKILEYEMNEREREIDGIKENLKRYSELTALRFSSDRGTLLNAIIAQCNALKAKFTGSLNDIHIGKLTVTLAYVHFTVLKEHYEHGSKFFNDFNAGKARQSFHRIFNEYSQHLAMVFPKWRHWRADLIEAKVWTESKTQRQVVLSRSCASVTDRLVSDQPSQTWYSGWRPGKNGLPDYTSEAVGYKENKLNELTVEYSKIRMRAYDLAKMLP